MANIEGNVQLYLGTWPGTRVVFCIRLLTTLKVKKQGVRGCQYQDRLYLRRDFDYSLGWGVESGTDESTNGSRDEVVA